MDSIVKSSFSNVTIGERKSSDYGTPLDFFDRLHSIFQFKTDPCSFPENRLKLPHIYTKKDDGLSHSWPWNTFINPPFGTKKGEKVNNWIKKMKEESSGHPESTYVMLLPSRLESNWFQDEIWKDPSIHVYIVKGRLRFYNPHTNKNNDPHPIGSMLLISGKYIIIDKFYDLQRIIPGIFITQGNYSN